MSNKKTPLYYTAEIVKIEHPGAVTVFFSPCVAKRKEGKQNPKVDYVVNFEELGAWFIAKKVEVATCEKTEFANEASKQGREFALSGGVARAVESLVDEKAGLKAHHINGLNKQSIKELKKCAKDGECPLGNLIEVMACEGGCIAGNATINSLKTAFKLVSAYGDLSKSIE